MAFYSETIVNGGDCLYLISAAGGGTYDQYVTSPSPYSDTDWNRNAFSLTGNISGCSDSGITNGSNGYIGAGPVSDGSYTFTGATTGASTFYVCSGAWSLTTCGGGGGGTTTEFKLDVVNVSLSTLGAGIFLGLILAFIAHLISTQK